MVELARQRVKMSVSLFLYERPSVSTTAYIGDLTMFAKNTWRRTIAAIGGYMVGDFKITEDITTRNGLISFFTNNIGRRVLESTFGFPTWEGEIIRMDLTLDGITYRRTLEHEQWHNKVKVAYTDNATNISTATAWVENASSSDYYGEGQYIDFVSDHYDATSATGLRDRRLTEYAFPKPSPVGDLMALATDSLAAGNSLSVLCGGYVFSMNRRYRESDIAVADISDQIVTLVGGAEFVTAGRIAPNTTQMAVSCSEVPMRLWNIIEELIEAGDQNGNRWAGGVYENRRLNYNLAATDVTHYWHGGQLVNRQFVPIKPSMIRPDIIVQITGSPFGDSPPGGATFDNPKNIYIVETEFAAPASYRLIFEEI